MSTATATTPARVITLTLTELEAAALNLVCDYIGGKPEGSRGIFSCTPTSISEQLDALNVSSVGLENLAGSLTFGEPFKSTSSRF